MDGGDWREWICSGCLPVLWWAHSVPEAGSRRGYALPSLWERNHAEQWSSADHVSSASKDQTYCLVGWRRVSAGLRASLGGVANPNPPRRTATEARKSKAIATGTTGGLPGIPRSIGRRKDCLRGGHV